MQYPNWSSEQWKAVGEQGASSEGPSESKVRAHYCEEGKKIENLDNFKKGTKKMEEVNKDTRT